MYFINSALENINLKNIIWYSSKEFDVINGKLKIINKSNRYYLCNNNVIIYIKYSVARKYYDCKNLINNITCWKVDNYFVCVFNVNNFPSIFIDDNYKFDNYSINFKFDVTKYDNDYNRDNFHNYEYNVFDNKLSFKYKAYDDFIDPYDEIIDPRLNKNNFCCIL